MCGPYVRAKIRFVAALAVMASANNVFAADTPDGDASTPSVTLDTVSVVATKSERDIGDIAGSVSVISREEIEDELVQNIKDLVRFEPGISVKNDPNRFGLSGFNIRGVDGDRVAVEVDGVPSATGFAVGSFSNAGRDYVDPEILKRVEILRGSASGLYGSDAIGGVVSFVTKDPSDYLNQAASNHFLGLRGGYYGGDNSRLVTATTAVDLGSSQALLLGSHRDGQEAATPFPDNPKTHRDNNLLFKYVWYPAADQELKFTTDIADSQTNTNMISLVHGPGRFASTNLLYGDDALKRRRYSVDYSLFGDGTKLDQFRGRIYYQDSTQSQSTLQGLDPSSRTPDPTTRMREFSYSQDLRGVELVGESPLRVSSLTQQFVYGLEVESVEIRELRNGVLTNLATGDVSNVIIGEEFPVRDFPLSTTSSYSLFVQDEITFGRGTVTLIPGLRYDYYKLDARMDQVFTEDNPGTLVTDSSMDHLSPKLGLVVDIADGQTIFAQISQGFRAPPFEDVNIGFTIPLFGYQAIPNPDLKPETSKGYEFGWRLSRPGKSVSVASYYNRYRNFIESRVNLGVDPTSGLLIFQSQNRQDAVIYGLELASQFSLGESFDLRTAMSWSRGEDINSNQPLNTVSPPTATMMLTYSPTRRWGISVIANAAQKQDRVDQSNGPKFQPGGYAVFDLNGYWQLGERTRLTAGVFNLTDKTYWEWVDVAGLPMDDPLIDIYARPGRHASMTISFDF